jgi:hypothetical protein
MVYLESSSLLLHDVFSLRHGVLSFLKFKYLIQLKLILMVKIELGI